MRAALVLGLRDTGGAVLRRDAQCDLHAASDAKVSSTGAHCGPHTMQQKAMLHFGAAHKPMVKGGSRPLQLLLLAASVVAGTSVDTHVHATERSNNNDNDNDSNNNQAWLTPVRYGRSSLACISVPWRSDGGGGGLGDALLQWSSCGCDGTSNIYTIGRALKGYALEAIRPTGGHRNEPRRQRAPASRRGDGGGGELDATSGSVHTGGLSTINKQPPVGQAAEGGPGNAWLSAPANPISSGVSSGAAEFDANPPRHTRRRCTRRHSSRRPRQGRHALRCTALQHGQPNRGKGGHAKIAAQGKGGRSHVPRILRESGASSCPEHARACALERGVNTRARKLAPRPHAIAGS